MTNKRERKKNRQREKDRQIETKREQRKVSLLTPDPVNASINVKLKF